MKTLELQVPPLAVLALAALAMWLCSRVQPAFDVPLRARVLAAEGVAAAGVIVAWLGVRAFRRARTTVNPMRPEGASTLVAVGIYRYTRNPMYLGMLLVLIAWALLLARGLSLLVLPLFVLYMNRFQIIPEERVLAQRFGAGFAEYKGQVRRWL